MVTAPELKKKLAMLKKIKLTAVAFSIHDMDSIKKIKKILNVVARLKHVK